MLSVNEFHTVQPGLSQAGFFHRYGEHYTVEQYGERSEPKQTACQLQALALVYG